MKAKQTISQDQKNLMRRYLIWCYKTTKEDLDRVERYFTQSAVDAHMLKTLKRAGAFRRDMEYARLVEDFEAYMQRKTASAAEKKFSDAGQKNLRPQHVYLTQRLQAVEKAVVSFLGKAELKNIIRLYEEEMTRRILSAREHT